MSMKKCKIPECSAIYKWITSIVDCKFPIIDYEYVNNRTYFRYLPRYRLIDLYDYNILDYELIWCVSELSVVYLDGKIKDWQKADNEFFEKYHGETFIFSCDDKKIIVPDMLEVLVMTSF